MKVGDFRNAYDIYTIFTEIQRERFPLAGLIDLAPELPNDELVRTKQKRILPDLPLVSRAMINPEEAFFVLTGVAPWRACTGFIWYPMKGWIHPEALEQGCKIDDHQPGYQELEIHYIDVAHQSLEGGGDLFAGKFPRELRCMTMRPDYGLRCITSNLSEPPVTTYEENVRHFLNQGSNRLAIQSIHTALSSGEIKESARLTEWLKVFQVDRFDLSHIPMEYFEDGMAKLMRDSEELGSIKEALHRKEIELFAATEKSDQVALEINRYKLDNERLMREQQDAEAKLKETRSTLAEKEGILARLSKEMADLEFKYSGVNDEMSRLIEESAKNKLGNNPSDEGMHPKERKSVCRLLGYIAIHYLGWNPDERCNVSQYKRESVSTYQRKNARLVPDSGRGCALLEEIETG
jgi:hypothetical protein